MRTILFFLLASVLVSACTTSTTPEPDSQLITVGTVSQGDLTLQVLAERPLEAGYNPVFLRIERNGSPVNDAHIELSPLMDMGMMKHSCPVTQPADAPDASGLYTAAVIFTMGGTAEQWSLNLRIHDHATSNTYDVTLPIAVASTPYVSVVKNGMSKTIVTLVRREWRTGMNNVQFIVHHTSDGYAYEPILGLTSIIEPTMPSMGHGSPGNVHPVHVHDGWYEGRVNFTMTGEWDLALDLFSNEEPLAAAHFLVQVN